MKTRHILIFLQACVFYGCSQNPSKEEKSATNDLEVNDLLLKGYKSQSLYHFIPENNTNKIGFKTLLTLIPIFL
jgi:hypothetical protein